MLRVCLGVLAVASVAADTEPRILSMVAGLPRCIGVPGLAEARAWGCPVINVTQADGSTTAEACDACQTPLALALACHGQGMHNSTGQDGTPVTFSLPVDMGSVEASHFQWTFSDGTTRAAACAIRNGNPAGEDNEQQTIAIVGDAGGWGDAHIVKMSIVGPLMLRRPNGSTVSAQGLQYAGPSLAWEGGTTLLDARLEAFSTAGEELHGGAFPNHCRINFPATTHRIRLLWDGGVSHDGRRAFNPDEAAHLFRVKDASGAELPAASVLGLADLGNKPAGSSAAERDGYAADGDNYLDICLLVGAGDAVPASVDVICGEDTQISMPKGLKKASNGLAPRSAPRCAPHTVSVHARDDAHTGATPFSY